MPDQNSSDDFNIRIRWCYSPRRRRLIGAVTTLRIELRSLIKLKRGDDDKVDPVYNDCEALLKKAKIACEKWNAGDLGWQCVHAAHRLMVTNLSHEEHKAIALALREEALNSNKFSPWRKRSIEQLLPEAKRLFPEADSHKPGADSHKPEADSQKKAEPATLKPNLLQSLLIVHDQYGTDYHKLASIQWQLSVLFIVAVAASGVWIKYAPWDLGNDAVRGMWDWKWRALAALCGVMGATLSGIFSVSKNWTQGRIPDLLLSWHVTLARLAVGAISALVLQVALISGLLKFQEIKATQGIVLIAAFAAGLTERLVIRAVETVAPPSKS
jgi:hypothetical protein